MAIDPSILFQGNSGQVANRIESNRRARVNERQQQQQLNQRNRQLDQQENRDTAAFNEQRRKQLVAAGVQRSIQALAEDPSNRQARDFLRQHGSKILEGLDDEQRKDAERDTLKALEVFGELGTIGEELTPMQTQILDRRFAELKEEGVIPDTITREQLNDPKFLRQQRATQTFAGMSLPGLPSEVREALAKGFIPGTEAYRKAVENKKPLVTVNTAGEKKFDEEVAKADVKYYNELRDAGQVARNTLTAVSVGRSILEGVDGDELPTGALAGLKTSALKIADSLGLNIQGFDLSDKIGRAEAFTALATEFALTRVGSTSGSVSNAEMQLFIESVPGLARTVEGNRLILEVMERRSQRDKTVAQYAQKAIDKKITRAELEDRLNTLNEQPLFSQEELDNIQSVAKSSNASRAQRHASPTTQEEFDNLPSGATFINPADGKIMVKP